MSQARFQQVIGNGKRRPARGLAISASLLPADGVRLVAEAQKAVQAGDLSFLKP